VSVEQVFKKAEALYPEMVDQRKQQQEPGVPRLIAAIAGILRGLVSDNNFGEPVPQKMEEGSKSGEFDPYNTDHLLIIARIASAAATLELQPTMSPAPTSPGRIRVPDRRVPSPRMRRASAWYPTLMQLTSELCVLEWRRKGELPANEVIYLARA
jgi:hypothetical protein